MPTEATFAYWINDQILQKESHHFLEADEECKVIHGCDADSTFIEIATNLECSLNFIENRIYLYRAMIFNNMSNVYIL